MRLSSVNRLRISAWLWLAAFNGGALTDSRAGCADEGCISSLFFCRSTFTSGPCDDPKSQTNQVELAAKIPNQSLEFYLDRWNQAASPPGDREHHAKELQAATAAANYWDAIPGGSGPLAVDIGVSVEHALCANLA